MYLGKIVEMANNFDIYNNPQHPYTEALISAVPIADPTINKKSTILEGDIPDPINILNDGCRFFNRCKYSEAICKKKEPELIDLGNEHFVACHLKSKEGEKQ